MAAINLSSPPLRSPPPIRCYHLSKTATTISLYSHPKPSFLFPKISLRPKNTTKPRYRSTVVSALSKLSDADLVDVPSEPDELSGTFPSSSGVYAVYDKRGGLQFIGMSRNIASSILTHQKSMPELCCSVKVGLVDLPVRTAMAEVWKSWMEEYITATGKVPPGNEPGNTTWFRQPSPPRKTKSDLRLTPGRNTQLTVPLEQLIDRLVKENTVVAFIKGSRNAPLCGFSQKVVGILNTEGVEYESVDVLDEEHNPGLRETLKKYSNWPTFPQVFVNGELVGGCDILSSMHEKGELSELIWK